MNKSTAFAAIAILSACIAAPPATAGTAKPAPLFYATFQDHAVIQRGKPVPLWGLTAPGAKVEISFAGKTATATADSGGRWNTVLPAMDAGGPYTLSAKSSDGTSQTLSDIMTGDVYLCSGQSNMELPLRLATNYDGELRDAANKNIRLFHVQRFTSPAPRDTFGAGADWAVLSPETAAEFSATCYYFGRDVQPAAGVAVGLIEDAWGGSAIQAWISNGKMAALGGYDDVLGIVKAYAKSPQDGDSKWRALVHGWFDSHDPAMKASPPWYDPALDDSGWNEDVATGGWRSWPRLAKFDGIVWIRKTVELSASDAAGAATLSLGTIGGSDLTFVNGTEVGAGEGYDVPRNYTVPAGVLHPGKNTIAIGMLHGGGFLDRAEKMVLEPANGAAVALTGPWKWKISAPASQTGWLPHQPWLNQFGLSTLYNGMIVPLGDTQIRGIVWYQGETDTGQPGEYRRLLRALIEDWRSKFGAGTPFYVVQLTSYGPPRTEPGQSNWAELRESQRYVVDTTPNTGLAVIIDLGSPDNIHPQAKQEVGRRLALLARQQIYGQAVESHSPSPVSVTRQGKTITIRFDHVGAGLIAREWDRAVGFQLCTAPNDCRYTDGKVSRDTVTLDDTPKVKAASVRFCWADSPLCNLYSQEGLPAVPFEMPVAAIQPAKKAVKH